MPYKNIVFVKLLWKELLHEDTRFIEALNDEQKGLYLMLLLLAGATDNNIKNDEKYIKRVLNLSEKELKIRENLDILLKTFPKFVSKNGFLKFKNFKELHNYIRQPKVLPEDCPGAALDKNRIDKIRKEQITPVVEYFVKTKNYARETISPNNWIRYSVAAKNLLLSTAGNVDQAIQAIDWVASGDYEWSLETVVKKFPDFMKGFRGNSLEIREALKAVKEEQCQIAVESHNP